MVHLVIHLDVGISGLNWTAKLYDSSSNQIGGDVTTGFVEDNSNYTWTYDAPDNIAGGRVMFFADNGLEYEYDVSSIPVTPSASPQVTVYTTCVDAHGNVETGVDFTFRLVSGPGTAGGAYNNVEQVSTSGDDGVMSIILIRNSTYAVRRQAGDWIKFQTADSDTMALPEILGKPLLSN